MALWDKLSGKMKETIVKGVTLAGITVTSITSVGAGVEQQQQLDQMEDSSRDPVSIERLLQDAPIKTSMEAFNEMDDLMGQSERQQEIEEATDPRLKAAMFSAGAEGPKGAGDGIPGKDPGPVQTESGDYYFTGTAEANLKYGSGGIQQCFIQNAYELKKEHPAAGNGRLIEVDREYEDPDFAQRNGQPDGVTSHQFGSTHATVDHRPLTAEGKAEMAQLDTSTPMEEGKSIQSLDVEQNLDTAYLDENTIDARGLNREGADVKKEAWIRPFSNQEDDKLEPDGWKNPEQLKDGQTFYQLSVDGDTTSSYFVTEDVVDSCRKEDGTVDFNQLRDGLQIPQGEQKNCLVKYVYRTGRESSNQDKSEPDKAYADPPDHKNLLGSNDKNNHNSDGLKNHDGPENESDEDGKNTDVTKIGDENQSKVAARESGLNEKRETEARQTTQAGNVQEDGSRNVRAEDPNKDEVKTRQTDPNQENKTETEQTTQTGNVQEDGSRNVRAEDPNKDEVKTRQADPNQENKTETEQTTQTGNIQEDGSRNVRAEDPNKDEVKTRQTDPNQENKTETEQTTQTGNVQEDGSRNVRAEDPNKDEVKTRQADPNQENKTETEQTTQTGNIQEDGSRNVRAEDPNKDEVKTRQTDPSQENKTEAGQTALTGKPRAEDPTKVQAVGRQGLWNKNAKAEDLDKDKDKVAAQQTGQSENQETENTNQRTGLPAVQTNTNLPALWEKPSTGQEKNENQTNKAAKEGDRHEWEKPGAEKSGAMEDKPSNTKTTDKQETHSTGSTQKDNQGKEQPTSSGGQNRDDDGGYHL